MRRASRSHKALEYVIVGIGWGLPVTSSAAPKPGPTMSELTKADELRLSHERLFEEGKYEAAIPLAEQACSILEREVGRKSVEFASCLNSLGVYRSKKGDYNEAKTLLERALAIRTKAMGPRHVSVARTLENLAVLYLRQGNYERAEALLEQALIIHTMKDSEPTNVANTLNNLAGLYQTQGRYEKAKPAFERAISIYETELGPEHPKVANGLHNLAGLYQIQGDYDQAVSLYERALSIRKKVLPPEHPSLATTLNNLAMLYMDKGEYEVATPILEQALTIREQSLGLQHPHVATTLNNLALLYINQGKYGQVEPLLRRALNTQENMLGHQHPEVATTLNNLALLFATQGEYRKAKPFYERALSIWETLGAEHPNVASGLVNLAGIYWRQGEYVKARHFHERALSIRENALGSEHPHVAASLDHIARIYEKQGDDSQAELLYQRALSIREATLDPRHPGVAITLNNLGNLYLRRGDYERAESLLERALSVKQSALGTHHPEVAITLNNLARLHQTRGDYEKAEALFIRAHSIVQNALGINHPKTAAILLNLGVLYLDIGRNESALELQYKAMAIEDENFFRNLFVAAESRQLAYARLLGSTHYMLSLHLRVAYDDHKTAEHALTTVLRRKGQVQDFGSRSFAVLQRSLPVEHQHILDELLSANARYSALAHRDRDRISADDFYAGLSKIQKQQDQLWSGLVEHSIIVESLTKPVTIADVQQAILGDTALLEFVEYIPRHQDGRFKQEAGEPRYAAYILFPHSFTWVDLGPAAPIDAQIQSFRDAITRRADAAPHARALYSSVMKPVVDRVGLTNRLFISPDGDLNLVPFEALVDEYDNYLVERFHLHYLTSGRDLLRPWALESPADGPVVVVANPSGAELPGTGHEATLLASLFPDAITMQHDSASETELRTHERPRILHLATHGTFGTGRPGHTLFDATPDDDLFRAGTSVFDGLPPTQLDNPMLYSWLDLATPPTLPAPPDDPSTTDDILDTDDEALLDDGKLTAYEVSGWDLRGTELVTLSACDTAQGTYQQGEGILGLRRAFAIAGAQTQVMSLWKVSDTATAKLMDGYYRRLLAGEGRSEAMRNTQLELLRDPATRHPRDWAAFVVVGEWGPLSSATAPPKADPPPIDSRPRGCQATVGVPANDDATSLLLVGLIGLLRRREVRRPARPCKREDDPT